MSDEKKGLKNLSTYAVIMFLAAVLLIIIAAMADTREEHFENQISAQTQQNIDIQNQIVKLEDENYKLKKDLEQIQGENQGNLSGHTFYKAMTQVYTLYLEGKTAAAAKTLGAIDTGILNQEQLSDYNLLIKLLKLPIPTKTAE